MGSQAIQSTLWGPGASDWADYQEVTSQAGYEYALQELNLSKGVTLLDVGCGSGYFCSLADTTGATVTGFDATEPLVQQAMKRAPGVDFLTGEMEALPFPDASFDIVTGFNSFQYAASISNALAEARRVLKPGGRFLTMIWGNKEDCEGATFLAAIGRLLPPPPPGAPGPFALSEGHRLEQLLTEAGFQIISATDVPVIWNYPDLETAIKGLLSSGPSARAIDHSGYATVHAAILQSTLPYQRADGNVIYHNTYRVVIGTTK